jgi:hypothetical protein
MSRAGKSQAVSKLFCGNTKQISIFSSGVHAGRLKNPFLPDQLFTNSDVIMLTLPIYNPQNLDSPLPFEHDSRSVIFAPPVILVGPSPAIFLPAGHLIAKTQ